MTLVASSTTNGDLWKQAQYTVGTAAFSSTYEAAVCVYYVRVLYNSSAQTTGPVLYKVMDITTVANAILINSNKFADTLADQTSLPTPQVLSATSSTGSVLFIWLY